MTTAERRVGELEADVERLRATVAAIWRRLEAPGSRAPSAMLPSMPRAPEPPALGDEVLPAAKAAKLLGCTTGHVRRLVRDGVLEGAAQPMPGRSRRRWVVSAHALRARLAARSSTLAARNGPAHVRDSIR